MQVTFLGKVTGEDLQRLADTYRDVESRMEVTPDRITDLSDWIVDALVVESSEVRAFAVKRQLAQLKNKVKSAIIAPKPEQYGLARMFQAYNDNQAIEITVFKDSASAYKWIGREAKDVDKVKASPFFSANASWPPRPRLHG